MIDCLLLKSSAEPVRPCSAGGVSYTSQNLCQAREFNLFIKLTCLTCFASLLSLSTSPRCEAAILVIFNSVSSDVLHHFSLHFKTTPELLSHHPVGMARIIGSF
jgi:hypothetical protein